MTLNVIDETPRPADDTDARDPRPRRGLGITALVLASLGVAGIALSRDPGVRAVVREGVADGRVRAAANELKQAVTDAWRDHGGSDAVAHAVSRGIRTPRS